MLLLLLILLFSRVVGGLPLSAPTSHIVIIVIVLTLTVFITTLRLHGVGVLIEADLGAGTDGPLPRRRLLTIVRRAALVRRVLVLIVDIAITLRLLR